jgi:hypothetical protein
MNAHLIPTLVKRLALRSAVADSLGILGLLVLAGCAGPAHKPAGLMQGTASPPAAPPSGKALVCIHRPAAHGGRFVKTGVWDSTHLVGALGSGHSVAYVCDPGQHYFVSRSSDMVAVVEAQLLADKTYDLRVETGGLVPSLKIKPLKPSDPEAKKVAQWSKENLWVVPGQSAAAYEQKKGESVEEILRDFVHGSKQNRVEHLSSEDHR